MTPTKGDPCCPKITGVCWNFNTLRGLFSQSTIESYIFESSCPVPIEGWAGLFPYVNSLLYFASVSHTLFLFESFCRTLVLWVSLKYLVQKHECCWSVLNYLWCLLPTHIKNIHSRLRYFTDTSYHLILSPVADVTTRFDCVFWCGDFNFRLSESRQKVENWANQLRVGDRSDFNVLLQHDQLRKSMNKSKYTVKPLNFSNFARALNSRNFVPAK